MRQFTKLNASGSLIRDDFDGIIYSYRTPIYFEVVLKDKTLKVFNNTYYSHTTRKHQNKLSGYMTQADIILNYCPYGNFTLEAGLINEISLVRHELAKLNNKTHKLGKRQAETLETLTKRLQELQQLYREM